MRIKCFYCGEDCGYNSFYYSCFDWDKICYKCWEMEIYSVKKVPWGPNKGSASPKMYNVKRFIKND